MKVQQGTIMASLHDTFPMFMDRWHLRPLVNVNAPAVFFGCYGSSQLLQVQRHRSEIIMVWLGSDFALTGDHKIWDQDNIHHVAIGPWIEKDLHERGISFRRFNIIGSPLVDELSVEPLGTAVYSYVPSKKRDFYGADLVAETMERLPDVEFIVHDGLKVPQSAMPDVYRRCCCGMRLLKHDGGSETVIEMGLMGRMSIHNGDTPASIPWDGVGDVVRQIERQVACAGTTRTIIADGIRDHVQMTDEWLDLETWQ